MWIETEPTKNPKGKDKTKSVGSTVFDAGHQVGKNHTTARQRQKKLEKLVATQNNADQNKIRTEE